MNTSSSDYWEIRNHLPDEIEPGFDRTAIHQALYQMAGLGVSLALALVGGLVTGTSDSYDYSILNSVLFPRIIQYGS